MRESHVHERCVGKGRSEGTRGDKMEHEVREIHMHGGLGRREGKGCEGDGRKRRQEVKSD